MVPFLVQHMLHQIKAPQFYTHLSLQLTVLNPLSNGKGLLSIFQVLFKANFIFKDFSRQSCILMSNENAPPTNITISF